MRAAFVQVAATDREDTVSVMISNLDAPVYRYLAKQEFLQRADLRQFELEREQRLKTFKRLH